MAADNHNSFADTPFAGPFSGDVHQAINPWSWAANIMNQAGFININNIQSTDPAQEKHIIENIASYGHQLKALNAVVDVLIENITSKNLSDEANNTIEEFQSIQKRIAHLKASRADKMTPI